MSNQSLINELNSTLVQINRQIHEATKAADEKNAPVEQLRKIDGGWIMTELLIAKAQVLNGLAVLQAAKRTVITNKR